MGKGVKIKLKNQKENASKKYAAFLTTAEIYRERAAARWEPECILTLRSISFLSFP